MTVAIELSGTLGSLNVGVAAAVAFLWPLGAQIDFLLALGLGPFEFDLAIQFEASLALQASLSLSISDPLLGLQLALQAVAQLQAALQAALTLPTFSISIGAELSASISLAAALSAKLGNIKLLIEAALAIKIPAMKLAMQLQLALSAGPAFLLSITGTDLATAGTDISTMFTAGLVDPGPPNSILPADPVTGIILITKNAAAGAAIGFLFGI
jgi:hypothetical protein